MDAGLVQMIYIVYIFSFRGDVQVQNVSFRGTTSSFMMDLSIDMSENNTFQYDIRGW